MSGGSLPLRRVQKRADLGGKIPKSGAVRELASLNGHGIAVPQILEDSPACNLPSAALRHDHGRDTCFSVHSLAVVLKRLTCRTGSFCRRAVCSSQTASDQPVDICRSERSKTHAVVRPLGLVIASRSLFDFRACSTITNDKWQNRQGVPHKHFVDIERTLPEAILPKALRLDDCVHVDLASVMLK